MAIDIVTEKATLSARELPVTFTLRIWRTPSRRYAGTISNAFPFNAQLYRVGMSYISEIPHTPDQCTYEFLLSLDSYILIEYQGKQYILDAQIAEEEVH